MRQMGVLILAIFLVAAAGGAACSYGGGGQGSPAPSAGY